MPCKHCNNAHAQIQAVKSRSISLGVYYAYLTTRDYPNNLHTQRIFFSILYSGRNISLYGKCMQTPQQHICNAATPVSNPGASPEGTKKNTR